MISVLLRRGAASISLIYSKEEHFSTRPKTTTGRKKKQLVLGLIFAFALDVGGALFGMVSFTYKNRAAGLWPLQLQLPKILAMMTG